MNGILHVLPVRIEFSPTWRNPLGIDELTYRGLLLNLWVAAFRLLTVAISTGEAVIEFGEARFVRPRLRFPRALVGIGLSWYSDTAERTWGFCFYLGPVCLWIASQDGDGSHENPDDFTVDDHCPACGEPESECSCDDEVVA